MTNISLNQLVESLIVELSDVYPLKRLVRTKEFLADKIEEMRITLLRDEYRTNRVIDEPYYQVVNCLELVCLDNTCTVGNVTFTSKTDIYEISIAPLITGIGFDNIKYLGDLELKQMFYRRTLKAFIEYKPQYARPRPIFTLLENKLLIKNLPTKGMYFLKGALLYQKVSTACNWRSTANYPTPSPYKLKLLVKKDLLSTYPKTLPETSQDEVKAKN